MALAPIPVQQLPDTPFSRARNLRFMMSLLRQPFMLGPLVVGWMVAWGFSGWAFLRIAAKGTGARYELLAFGVLMGPVVGVGVALLLGLSPFLLLRRARLPALAWTPAPDDQVLLEQAAVHWRGTEPRQGRLYLTPREVIFTPDRYALAREVLRLESSALQGIKWFRSPAPEGFESTSTMLLSTPQGDQEILFRSLEGARKAAEAIAGSAGDQRLPS